jgi:hypothetical protein
MDHNPSFYLTTAGEYKPLADPCACLVRHCVNDPHHGTFLVVEVSPSVQLPDSPVGNVSWLVLSPRHKGDSLTCIHCWPCYVYVRHPPRSYIFESDLADLAKFQTIAIGKLYPTLEEAAQAAANHAAAVKSVRWPQEIWVQKLRFLGEQDGPPERELKLKLTRLFEPDERISRAYLAIADLGPGTSPAVILCLRTVMGPDRALINRILEQFAAQFRTSETLDILFIDSEQEAELAAVCKPFYARTIRRET